MLVYETINTICIVLLLALLLDEIVTDGVFTGGLEVVGEMKKQGVQFNKDTFMLAFATCYKLVKAM